MNLHHLKVFRAVAEAGSISAGAARLHISQPAVTREIRELEASAGVPLFDRRPRGVALTEGGQRLLQYAQPSNRPPSTSCAASPASARASCGSAPAPPSAPTCCRRCSAASAPSTRRCSSTCG